jgi:GT2 family glycosyltransferase
MQRDVLESLPVDWIAAVGRSHPARERPPTSGVRMGRRHDLVWGLCMAMRRKLFECAGGFDESYNGYAGEDTDLATTIFVLGVPAGLVGDAFVLHRHHDSFEPPLQQLELTLQNARTPSTTNGARGRWPDG